ncbi:MAG: RimK/LysX family protein [Verrucomicrobiales bacterium]
MSMTPEKLDKTSARAQENQSDMKAEMLMVGWREWVTLPLFDHKRVEVKVDTGARTSALLVSHMEASYLHGVEAVSFCLKIPGESTIGERYTHVIHAQRKVRSSNGHSELRYFIRVPVLLGKRQWLIELSLTTARKGMKYAMLLGRQAMANRMIVNPGKSHLLLGSNLSA